MNIVEIVQELLEYLKTHNGNRRTCDAMEECLELLKTDLPQEQREREIKRVGDTISYLLEQEQKPAVNALENERFSDSIRKRLEKCHQGCVAMAESKSLEQQPLIQGFENEFMTEMNANLNSEEMKERENLSELVIRSRQRLSDKICSVIKEFMENIMEEFDICMEKVRKTFAETQIEIYRTSYRDINENILDNYDSMQRNILAKGCTYEYPKEPFNDFSDELGVKMEEIAKKEHRINMFLKLLPIIIFLVKYVIDNYVIQKETWIDKLVNALIHAIESMDLSNGEIVVGMVEVITQFISDHQTGFELTANFLLSFFFFGWVYYIYIKIINHVRKDSLYIKQQAVIRPATEKFLRELNIQGEIQKVFVERVKLVEEQYMQRYKILFDKIVADNADTKSESVLQRLSSDYNEYLRNVQ